MAGQKLIGLVKSAGKMDKTVMVEVTRVVRHAKYNKPMRKMSRIMAHDEANVIALGEKVSTPALSINLHRYI